MHRNASDGKIIIADRRHAHDGEEAANNRQFLSGSDPDRAVAYDAQVIEFVGQSQLLLELGVPSEHLAVDVGNKLHQRAVSRHFGFVHVRHRNGKHRAYGISGNKGRSRHATSPIHEQRRTIKSVSDTISEALALR